MSRTLAALVGLIVSASFDVAVRTQWKADKNLLGRFERELCPLLDDGINTIQWQRLQVVKAMAEPGRQTLLYMAESRKRVSEWERQCAVGFLGELKEERAKLVLRHLVEDDTESDALRASAVVTLTTAFADVEVLPTLTAIVLQRRHGQDTLFIAALRALGGIDDDRARAALRELLSDPSLPKGNASGVVSYIEMQRDREAIPLLVSRGTSGDERARMEAARALGRIGTREGLVAARDVLGRMKDSRFKVAAAEEILRALKGHRQRNPDAEELAAIEDLTAMAQRVVAEAPPLP